MRATSSSKGSADVFATTRWTVVLDAGATPSPQSDQALEDLCRSYWYPLYAYVRRRGHSKEDAEDLVQGFFARFLQKNYLSNLSKERGRFRAFLLACLKHFLANEADRSGRKKRGGGVLHFSLDWETAESRFGAESVSEVSPDRQYDREWTLALLDRVVGRLERECADEGKTELFEHLKIFLTAGRGAKPQGVVAEELGLSEGAVRVAVHRLRKRYRALLRDEISQTLSDPIQVEEELCALFAAVET